MIFLFVIGGIVLTIGFAFLIWGLVRFIKSTDKEKRVSTRFMKLMIMKAETLYRANQEPSLQPIVKAVYEEMKYSDIISGASLVDINERIQKQFSAFEAAVKQVDVELATQEGYEAISLLNERKAICKLQK